MKTNRPEPKYRADIAYIGTAYSGFQSQLNGDSIQDRIEKAFSIFLRHPVSVRGASRTDSGVHAENQVIAFQSSTPFRPGEWLLSANALLPNDISVLQFSNAELTFDPIRDAQSKIYRYRLWRGHCASPFLKPYVWGVQRQIDLSNLADEITHFVGTHDFSSFCNTDSDAATRTREILEVRVDIRDPLVDIWIVGRGFLKQMVRIIVGTLVDIALGKKQRGTVPQILQAKQRDLAGQTAPAHGLTLVKILYDELPNLSSVIREASRGYCLKV